MIYIFNFKSCALYGQKSVRYRVGQIHNFGTYFLDDLKGYTQQPQKKNYILCTGFIIYMFNFITSHLLGLND